MTTLQVTDAQILKARAAIIHYFAHNSGPTPVCNLIGLARNNNGPISADLSREVVDLMTRKGELVRQRQPGTIGSCYSLGVVNPKFEEELDKAPATPKTPKTPKAKDEAYKKPVRSALPR